MNASTTPLSVRATRDDLMRCEGKAELIDGRIVPLMAAGRRHNRVAGRIFKSLDDHAEMTGQGEAYTDNMGFLVAELPSGRESFSPDASFSFGPYPDDDRDFLEGAPVFAVEVRSKSEIGPSAERDRAAKRTDYFAAGSQAVWDVDPDAEQVHAYRQGAPDRPVTFERGQDADAEPAVPGWRIAVDRIFD